MPDVETHLFGAYKVVTESTEERLTTIDAFLYREFDAWRLHQNGLMMGASQEILHRLHNIALDTQGERMFYRSESRHYLFGVPVPPVFRYIRETLEDFEEECQMMAHHFRESLAVRAPSLKS